VLLLILGGVALNTSGALNKGLATGMGTFSTLVAAFIARTFLRAHSRALAQLNRYFGQEVAFGYVLTAERLSQLLPQGKRDSELEELIASTIATAEELARTPLEVEAEHDDQGRVTTRQTRRQRAKDRRERKREAERGTREENKMTHAGAARQPRLPLPRKRPSRISG
jgi:hypothetical protein